MQETAVSKAMDFAKLREPKSEFILSGLAGTGKTTTMVQVIQGLLDMGHRPAVCAPTGKAANVINKKQCHVVAGTIHKALSQRPLDALRKIHDRLDEIEALRAKGLMTPEIEKEEADLFKDLDRREYSGNHLSFEPKLIEDVLDEFTILLFDESSMIGRDKTYYNLIHPVPLPRIFVGDAAQLPPVKDEPAVDFKKADIHLTEILRQGSDSGILYYAHQLHKGRVPTMREMGQYGDVNLIPDGGLNTIKGHEDAQLIVWMNKERHQLVPKMRNARGFDFDRQKFSYLPMVGEQLYIDDNSVEMRVSRGQIVTVKQDPVYLFNGNRKTRTLNPNPYLCMVHCVDELGRDRALKISMTDLMPHPILEDASRDKSTRRFADIEGVKVLNASVITCHRAQGSEYPKVFMLGTMMPQGHADWRKWWYTAATRAQKELVVASYHYMHEGK